MSTDEIFATALRGGPVGKHAIPMDVAGPFLFRLHELVHAVATMIAGREGGRRGSLPQVPGAGLLALADVGWSSAVFHFEHGPGEEFRIGGEDQWSLTEEAVKIVTGLVDASSDEDPSDLFAHTQALGHRVGTNFELLIDVLAKHRVESEWQVRGSAPVVLTPTAAARAKVVLDLEAPPAVFEMEMSGRLYRADSREHLFILDPDEEREDDIKGHYSDALREDIREAWDKDVRVRLQVTHHFLRRQAEPHRVDHELIEILEITA